MTQRKIDGIFEKIARNTQAAHAHALRSAKTSDNLSQAMRLEDENPAVANELSPKKFVGKFITLCEKTEDDFFQEPELRPLIILQNVLANTSLSDDAATKEYDFWLVCECKDLFDKILIVFMRWANQVGMQQEMECFTVSCTAAAHSVAKFRNFTQDFQILENLILHQKNKLSSIKHNFNNALLKLGQECAFFDYSSSIFSQ